MLGRYPYLLRKYIILTSRPKGDRAGERKEFRLGPESAQLNAHGCELAEGEG